MGEELLPRWHSGAITKEGRRGCRALSYLPRGVTKSPHSDTCKHLATRDVWVKTQLSSLLQPSFISCLSAATDPE